MYAPEGIRTIPSNAKISPVPKYFNQALSQWNNPDTRCFANANEEFSKNTQHIHDVMSKSVLSKGRDFICM